MREGDIYCSFKWISTTFLFFFFIISCGFWTSGDCLMELLLWCLFFWWALPPFHWILLLFFFLILKERILQCCGIALICRGCQRLTTSAGCHQSLLAQAVKAVVPNWTACAERGLLQLISSYYVCMYMHCPY